MKPKRYTREKDQLTIEAIRKEVCSYFFFSSDIFNIKNRTRKVNDARQIAVYLCKKLLKLKLKELAISFNRGHDTIFYSVKKVDELLKFDRIVKLRVKILKEIISAKYTTEGDTETWEIYESKINNLQ